MARGWHYLKLVEEPTYEYVRGKGWVITHIETWTKSKVVNAGQTIRTITFMDVEPKNPDDLVWACSLSSDPEKQLDIALEAVTPERRHIYWKRKNYDGQPKGIDYRYLTFTVEERRVGE